MRGMKKIGTLIFFFFFAYGAASFLNDYILQYEEIQGTSMEPLLTEGDHVLISPIPFWLGEPERFDIIAFSWRNQLYVKRVIGLPGESVAIRDGRIYINERLLPENYGKEATEEDMEALSLGEGEYFVLGDNRNYSSDSRQKELGPVQRKQIVGKVLFK